MKRSLIMLLVLALVATMIPGLALAEETATEAAVTPTFELVLAEGETKDVTKKLEYDGNWYTTKSYKVTGMPEGSYVIWKSDNEKCASLGYTKVNVYDYIETYDLGIDFNGVGTANITGTLYNQYDEVQLKPIEIKVTLEEIPVAKVSFAEGVPAKTIAGTNLYLGRFVQIESALKDEAGNLYKPTEDPYSVSWSVEPEDLASIDRYGNLNCIKAGKVTVTAKAKSGAAATLAVEITAAREEETVDPEQVYFSSIQLSTSTFELAKGYSIYVPNYVTAAPIDADDELVITSDNEKVAKVEGYTITARQEGTAHITIASKYNPDCPAATITVTVVKPLPYKALTFKKTAITMNLGEAVEVENDYLKATKPEKNFGDYLVWSSSDQQVVDAIDGTVYAIKAGKATITVRSHLDPSIKATMDIEVKDPSEEGTNYEALTFIQDEVTMVIGDMDVDLYQYLNRNPLQEFIDRDWLIWTSSAPAIATVSAVGTVKAVREGTAVITVRSTRNAEAKAGTITIKVVAEEEKVIKSITATQAAITLKLKDDGIDLEQYLNIDPVDYDDQLVWTSSKPQYVAVNDGFVTLIKGRPGTATVTVRSKKNPEAAASIEVTLEKEELNKISFTKSVPTEITLKKGNFDLTKYIDTDPWYYIDSYAGELKSESSDPQVAGVYGLDVVPYSIGSTTITVYAEDNEAVKAEFNLTVKAIPVTEASFAKESFTLELDEVIDFSEYLKLKPFDANYDEITFTSSNPAKAAFDGSVLIPNKAGTVKVTATVRNDDGSIVTATTKVKVVDKKAESIAFKKKSYTVKLTNDESYQRLYLESTPADADVDWTTFHVETSNAEIATVGEPNSNGVVRVYGHKPGKVVIKVTSEDGKLTAKTKVNVKAVALSSVILPKDLKTITIPLYAVEAGSEYEQMNETTVHVNVKPSNAYYVASWKSTNPGVAYVVNDYGYAPTGRSATIRAIAPGLCKIKVTVTDGKKKITKSFNIVVKNATVSDLALSETRATVYMIKGGENTLQLTATDSKTDAAVPVAWATSDKKIATVDKTGLVTFKSAGKVKITATTVDGNSTRKSCTLTVKKLAVSKITAKKSLSMKAGDTAALNVTVKPAKAFNPAVSFKSSNKKVVTVDSEGNLVALKAGEAVITITAKDGSKKSAQVTITVKGNASNEVVETIDDAEIENEIGIDGLAIDGEAIEIVDGVAEVVIG